MLGTLPEHIQDCLAVLVLWYFHLKLEIAFSISVKKLCWNFDGDLLNLYSVFGRMAIFTVFILLIHEHGRSVHLLIHSSVS